MAAFRNWPDILGPSIEVRLIQMPGREHRWRERPMDSLTELIPPLQAAIGEFCDLPFAMYGHSIGGRIAFEVARGLQEAGAATPMHLFVGASPAPQLPLSHSPIRNLGDGALITEVGRRYGPIPSAVLKDAELLQLVERNLRADFSLIETRAQTELRPLQCPVTAFAGLHDKAVKLADMEAWREQTRSRFRLHTIAADHLFTQTSRDALLRFIADEMPGVHRGRAEDRNCA